MTDYRRYYLNASLNISFNAANTPKQIIKDLHNKIENVFEEFAIEMQEKGLSCEINWNWAEHTDI